LKLEVVGCSQILPGIQREGRGGATKWSINEKKLRKEWGGRKKDQVSDDSKEALSFVVKRKESQTSSPPQLLGPNREGRIHAWKSENAVGPKEGAHLSETTIS